MNRFSLFILLSLLMPIKAFAETPQWFKQELSQRVGTWITDNKQYLSEKEPQEHYVLVWKWDLDKLSITGRMYGLAKGKASSDFWHFRQYWDGLKQQARVMQYGNSGVIGEGYMEKMENGKINLVQEFSLPDGRKWKSKHISQDKDGTQITTSFDLDKDNKWVKDRSYTWERQSKKTNSNELDLGNFSISLNVKDIKKSVAFYENLGFIAVKNKGAIKHGWILLENGGARLGLFQGFFPKNTLTFNPENARKIHHRLKNNNISFQHTSGLENESGAASFSINDPDGNLILIDQH